MRHASIVDGVTVDELVRQVAEKLFEWRPDEWQPDTDMNHLWMVVERMRELGWYLIVWQYAVFYEVTFSQGSGTEDTIFNSNFNIAVLKAALKAVSGG